MSPGPTTDRGCGGVPVTLALGEATCNVNKDEKWEGELREMVADFIRVKTETRDESALTWVLQRTVFALSQIGVSRNTILNCVRKALPG